MPESHTIRHALIFFILSFALIACGANPPANNTPPGAATCIPGATESCACVDGTKGAQKCNMSMNFDDCACGTLPPHDAGTLAPPADAGTSTQTHSNLCVPGRSIECACTDGRTGAQVCDSSGQYGNCTCTMMMSPPDTGMMSMPDTGTADSGEMQMPVDAGFNGNCPPRFTGANCDQCIGNFTGPTCSACSPRFTGLNCNECSEPRFSGSNCTDCAAPDVVGANCDKYGFQMIAPGYQHVCGIKLDGTIACWGLNHVGQTTAPIGQFYDITSGAEYSCATRMSGLVTCWGDNNGSQATPPGDLFMNLSAPRNYTVGHVCGVRTDGSIECWGDFLMGTIPSGTDYVEIDSGGSHQCARKTDNSVVCWGSINSNQVPQNMTVTQMSAYESGNCGVATNGRLQCWGNVGWFPSDPPFGTDFTYVGIGDNHGCAVKTDNSAICWGTESLGQTTVPPDNYRAIHASRNYTCAIKTDDSVRCWGINTLGQCTPPRP
jgi:hypothetical protein